MTSVDTTNLLGNAPVNHELMGVKKISRQTTTQETAPPGGFRQSYALIKTDQFLLVCGRNLFKVGDDIQREIRISQYCKDQCLLKLSRAGKVERRVGENCVRPNQSIAVARKIGAEMEPPACF